MAACVRVTALALVAVAAAAAAAATRVGATGRGDSAPQNYSGSVYAGANGTLTFKAGVVDQGAAAFGYFVDSLNETGWGVLQLATSTQGGAASDLAQMRAAGLLEGALTWRRTYEFWLTAYNTFFGTAQPPQALDQYFAQQLAWTRQQIAQNAGSSPLWANVALIQAQLDGLAQGYALVADAGKQLPYMAFQILSAQGDMIELGDKFVPGRVPDWERLSEREVKLALLQRTKCSALVKLTSDYGELFSAHSTWDTFQDMNRIFKHYDFAGLSERSVASRRTSFSSYPGTLASVDDFYHMERLVMLETTNPVVNSSLLELIEPQALLAWQRVRIANAMANTGEEWFRVFEQYNSGTYNNQYMLIDYSRFRPGAPLPAGTLWVVEQMPGMVVGADLTDSLRYGYWPSYNIPAFASIYNISGFASLQARYGALFSYDLAPRAQIFRRDHHLVSDLASLQALMRYNDYKNDPASYGDPTATICARGDLLESGAGPFGCYDTKVTSAALRPSWTTLAESGPTRSHGLPPFSWAEYPAAVHDGQPEVWQFGFETMQPDWDMEL